MVFVLSVNCGHHQALAIIGNKEMENGHCLLKVLHKQQKPKSNSSLHHSETTSPCEVTLTRQFRLYVSQ